MKIKRILLFFQLLLLQVTLSAQVQLNQTQDRNNQNPSGTSAISIQALTSSSFVACYLWTTKLAVYPNPVMDQIMVSGLNKDEYDRLTVYNMQGAPILKQNINGESARIDVSSLTEGVYLLVLHSSVTLKEKNMKFVVRK